MNILKNIFLLVSVFFATSCTPKITHVTYETDFKKWNNSEKKNLVDSSASLAITVNTYKGFFKGRTPFTFKKEHYYFRFNKIDTLYSEKDIQDVAKMGDSTEIIPKYLRVKIKYLANERLLVKIDIKDDSLPDLFKGVFKLKFKNHYPDVVDVFKYYE